MNLSGEGSRFTAPYFALAESATHMGFGMTLGGGYSIRLGTVIQSDNFTASFNGPASPAVNTSGKTIATMEFQKNFKNFGEVGGSIAVVTLGQMLESNSLMGLGGNGALAFGGRANTGFITFAGSTPIAAKANLSAMASLGQTAAYSNSAASIIDGATASTSLAWSLGLAQMDVLRSGDSFGMTISMPLRTMSGAMTLTTATSQSQEDGSLKYSTQSVSLAPSGQERDFELAYASAVTGYFGGQMTAVANLKMEPGHVAGAATQYGIGLRYVKVF